MSLSLDNYLRALVLAHVSSYFSHTETDHVRAAGVGEAGKGQAEEGEKRRGGGGGSDRLDKRMGKESRAQK